MTVLVVAPLAALEVVVMVAPLAVMVNVFVEVVSMVEL